MSGRAFVRTTSALALLFVSLSVELAASAGETRLHVVLTDGTELAGELVEKVPGDHLTVQLATGEVRRIPWASIQSVTPANGPNDSSTSSPPNPIPTGPTVVVGVPMMGAPYTPLAHKEVSWPRPDRSPSPFDGNHLYLGVATGIGTPTGTFGAVVAWDPASYFELEAGVGTGARFGYGLSAMAHLELPLLKWMRMGLGVGYSTNTLSASARAADGEWPGAPRTARWLNLQFLEEDFAFGKSGFLRFSTGFAFLLNRSDYASSDSDTSTPGASLPVTPGNVGSRFHAPFVPFFGLTFVWRLT